MEEIHEKNIRHFTNIDRSKKRCTNKTYHRNIKLPCSYSHLVLEQGVLPLDDGCREHLLLLLVRAEPFGRPGSTIPPCRWSVRLEGVPRRWLGHWRVGIRV